MRLLWLIIIFLLIGAFIITTSYNLNLKKPEDRRTFIGKFAIWTVNIGKNVIKTVGYAMKFDWLPEKPDEQPAKKLNYTDYIIKE